MTTSGNAYLTFTNAAQPRLAETYLVKIVQLTESLNVQLTNNTNRAATHFYPVRTKQSDLQFSIQCRSLEQYDKIRESIRKAQERTINEGYNSGIARIRYPDRKIDYAGYIPNVTAGARRFEFAPVLSLFMVMIKDRIGNISVGSSSTTGVWKDIAGTSLVDIYKYDTSLNPESEADKTMANNAPAKSVPNGPGNVGTPMKAQ